MYKKTRWNVFGWSNGRGRFVGLFINYGSNYNYNNVYHTTNVSYHSDRNNAVPRVPIRSVICIVWYSCNIYILYTYIHIYRLANRRWEFDLLSVTFGLAHPNCSSSDCIYLPSLQSEDKLQISYRETRSLHFTPQLSPVWSMITQQTWARGLIVREQKVLEL